MARKFDLANQFGGCRIDYGHCTPVTYVHLPGISVVAEVVGVVQPVHIAGRRELRSCEDIDSSASPVRHEESLHFRDVSNALRLLKMLQAGTAFPSAKIDHFDAVIAQ